MQFLFVGLGGAIGAMLRFCISQIPYRGDFPLITLAINILGAFVIGIIVGNAAKLEMNENLILFFKTGVCGGFTTFSTFSLEAYTLVQKGLVVLAISYAFLSVVCCILGVMVGIAVSRTI